MMSDRYIVLDEVTFMLENSSNEEDCEDSRETDSEDN